MSEKKMVEIAEERYNDLLDSEMWLIAYENAGVDNWDGIDYAVDLYLEMKGEEE